AQARDALRLTIRPELVDQVRAQWAPRATPDWVANRVIARIEERWAADFDTCQSRYVAAATASTGELQELIQREAAELISIEGVKVAVDVLQEVSVELIETVVPELLADQDKHARMVADMRTRINAAVAGVAMNLPASHTKVEQAVDAAITCFHSR